MELAIFLHRKNIKRYQRLLKPGMRSAERRKIFRSLSEEMNKLKTDVRLPAGVCGRTSVNTRQIATRFGTK